MTLTTPETKVANRTPIIDPILMLFKSRSFVSAILLFGITTLCSQIPALIPFREEMFVMAMGIIAAVFTKNSAQDIAETMAAAKVTVANRPITDRTAMTQDIYDEMTDIMHDVMFGSASSNPQEVKEAIAQAVIKADVKQTAGTSSSKS